MPRVDIEEVDDPQDLSGLLSDEAWKDVQPLIPKCPGDPVVEIDKGPETGQLLGRFLAAKEAGELSPRVLALTEHIILHITSTDYTVWEWRWRCLLAGVSSAAVAAAQKSSEEERALNLSGLHLFDAEDVSPPPSSSTAPSDDVVGQNSLLLPSDKFDGPTQPSGRISPATLAHEMQLTASVAAFNPKNYQLWNARRKLAFHKGPLLSDDDADVELAFTEACLAEDAKNHHAWMHRQAVLAGAWSDRTAHDELELTEQLLLDDDVRNNSVWAQRMFVLRRLVSMELGAPGSSDRGPFRIAGGGPLPSGTLNKDHKLIQSELLLVRRALQSVPSNQATWNYLWGLRPLVEGGQLDPEIEALAKQVIVDAPWALPAQATLKRLSLP